jgi:hypothetical protein
MKFNEAVQAYNNAVLTFPGSLIAGFRNFAKRPFFTGDVAAQKAPTVDFGAPASYQPPASPTPAAAPAAPPAPAAATPAATPSPTPAAANPATTAPAAA